MHIIPKISQRPIGHIVIGADPVGIGVSDGVGVAFCLHSNRFRPILHRCMNARAERVDKILVILTYFSRSGRQINITV